jgi:hypothetical protein
MSGEELKNSRWYEASTNSCPCQLLLSPERLVLSMVSDVFMAFVAYRRRRRNGVIDTEIPGLNEQLS